MKNYTWVILVLIALSACGCAGSQSNVIQVNLSSSVIAGSKVKIVNIIGNVNGIPGSGMSNSQVITTLDDERLANHKMHDLIIESYEGEERPTFKPTANGWVVNVEYEIVVSNKSDKSLRVSGLGCIAAYTDDNSVLMTPQGVIRSDPVDIAPGDTGTLYFSVNRLSLASLYQYAEKKGYSIGEESIRFVPPNHGIEWRPNWSNYIGLSVQVIK